MIKAVTIGSLIVCHLLTGKSIDSPDGPTEQIKKVLGQIIDIKQRTLYYEDVKKKEVKAYEENFLYVKDNVSKEIFEINSTACMAVRPETEAEAKIRKYGNPSIQKVEQTYDEDGKVLSERSLSEKDFIKDTVLPDLKETLDDASKSMELPIKKENKKQDKNIPKEIIKAKEEKKVILEEKHDELDLIEKQISEEAKTKK